MRDALTAVLIKMICREPSVARRRRFCADARGRRPGCASCTQKAHRQADPRRGAGEPYQTGTPTDGRDHRPDAGDRPTLCFQPVDRWSMPLPLAVMVSFAVLGGDRRLYVASRYALGDLRLHSALQF